MTLLYLPENVAGGAYGIDTNCQGDQIVVGAPYSKSGEDIGAVYVLETTTGDVLYHLEPPCPQLYDNYGSSVAMNCDGSRVLVGSKKGFGSDPKTNSPGTVFLYDILPGDNANASSFVRLLQTFQNPHPQDYDEFGIVTAMDKAGETIAIAAPNHGQNEGVVYVFNKNGELIRGFRPSDVHDAGNIHDAGNERSERHDLFQDQFFGSSVAMSDDGTLLLIGAPGKGWTKQSPGAVYLFRTFTGELLLSIQNPAQKTTSSLERNTDFHDAWNDFFASSVAMSADGEIIAVGAMLVESSSQTPLTEKPTTTASKTLMGQPQAGQAYIFNRSGKLLETLMSPNTEDHFGIAVSLNAKGSLLLVAAPQSSAHEDTTISTSGVAYLFDTSGIPIHRIYNPLNTISGDDDEDTSNQQQSMEFGGKAVLAPSGKYAVVGSPFHPVLKVACFLSPRECPVWHPGKSKVGRSSPETPPIITVQYDDIFCPSLPSVPVAAPPNMTLAPTNAPRPASTQESPIFRLMDGISTTQILVAVGSVSLVLFCGSTLMYLLFRNSYRSNADTDTTTNRSRTFSTTSCYLPNQDSDEEKQDGRLPPMMMLSVLTGTHSPRRTHPEPDTIKNDQKEGGEEEEKHEEVYEGHSFYSNNIISADLEDSSASPKDELLQGLAIADPQEEDSKDEQEKDDQEDQLVPVESMETVDLESPASRSMQTRQDNTKTYTPDSLPEIL